MGTASVDASDRMHVVGANLNSYSIAVNVDSCMGKVSVQNIKCLLLCLSVSKKPLHVILRLVHLSFSLQGME